jgi:hypothetical protein
VNRRNHLETVQLERMPQRRTVKLQETEYDQDTFSWILNGASPHLFIPSISMTWTEKQNKGFPLKTRGFGS